MLQSDELVNYNGYSICLRIFTFLLINLAQSTVITRVQSILLTTSLFMRGQNILKLTVMSFVKKYKLAGGE